MPTLINRVNFPNSLWKCAGCKGKLSPVYLERHEDGVNSAIVCRCQRCHRLLGKTTELEIQCLYSKRIKPEQGELAELAVRVGLAKEYVATPDGEIV